ncbi:hypothetical protein [Paenibacillus sp. TSA_86.1]|uniref:hypothetical protein n=1 Tax=Paenibacillus sp. TSA_86.1 TaxID=3415649 RepID=UPI004045C009
MMIIKKMARKLVDIHLHNKPENRHCNAKHTIYTAYSAVFLLLVCALTGCGLERDEHTVQFQQMQQPNQQNESLPVWLDVYSKSVIQEVYSPQGNSEILH